MDDFALLQSFAKDHSDTAFDELMRRHVDLVYTAARRRTSDAHLADDVTQAVFIVLARKASSLRSDVILPAWLLSVTRITASNALRQRKNQSLIERKAVSMTSERSPQSAPSAMSDAPGTSDATQVAPLLDDAIAGLAENDRNALVLRYFSKCSLAEVGERLGVSAAAAEKRVSRATERLRQSLVRGGVALSVLALVQVLANSGVSAAPAEIAGKLSGAIAADAAGLQITPSVALANTTMRAMAPATLVKPVLIGAVALVAVSFLGGILIGRFMNRRPQASLNPAVVAAPDPALVPVVSPPSKQPPVYDSQIESGVGAMAPSREVSRDVPATPIQNPPMPFAPPADLVPAQGTTVDLLSRVNLASDNLNGEWTQSPGSLQSGLYAFSIVQLPYSPPEEYDFRASFTVIQPRGEIIMLCARKDADFGWKMGAHENKVNIFDITPGYLPKNSSRREADAVFSAGSHYDVTVQVRNNGVAAYINGQLNSQLETNYRGMSVFAFWQLQNRAALGVGTWGTSTRFDRIEVVEISGKGKWLRTDEQPATPRPRPVLTDAAEWTKAVDLMPTIDPARDAVSGAWTRNAAGELVSDKVSLARLEIPYQPPEEYDYKMVFTRNTGWDVIAQSFGHGKVSGNWRMAMWGNELNMFHAVSNTWEGHNPTTVWAKEFIENGRRYESIIQVRKQGFAAFVDGKLISFWDRGYDGVHVAKTWVMPTPGSLGFGVNKSQMTVHALQVLEITGKGEQVAAPPVKRLEAVPEIATPDAAQPPSSVKPPKAPTEAF